jgi:hypothetical protein
MTNRSERHTVDVLFIAESDLAIYVSEDGGDTKISLPKSQIDYPTDPRGNAKPKVDGTIEIEVPIWLLSDRKFAGY